MLSSSLCREPENPELRRAASRCWRSAGGATDRSRNNGTGIEEQFGGVGHCVPGLSCRQTPHLPGSQGPGPFLSPSRLSRRWPGSANETQPFDSTAGVATILNHVPALAVGIDLLNSHGLCTFDARYERRQRAFVIIHWRGNLRHDQRLRQLASECAPMTSEATDGARIPSKIKAIAVESAWMLRHGFIGRPAPGRSFRVKGIESGMTVLSRS
jgi:hypothetical protein